jgi:hypothetical protein
MSIIAGAMALKPNGALGPDVVAQIRKAISRNPVDEVTSFETRILYLAKIDNGAFGAPAVHEDANGSASYLAGEPLLSDGGEAAGSRAADLERLHREWADFNWSGLAQSTGAFCAVHYNAERAAAVLIGDKLGLRPIYYFLKNDLLVFATAVRILEQLRFAPLEIDLRGVTETAVFGYPLDERTAYAHISTIGAGQVVVVANEQVKTSRYWRWDQLAPPQGSAAEMSHEIHRRFVAAVRRRLHGASTAVAFMTGGLDSRTIVGALRELGANVHTINYALQGTQDYAYAAQLASVLGTRHHQLAIDLKSMYAFRGRLWNQGPVLQWFESDAEVRRLPRQVWSGDGGSVALGHVYLNHDIIRLAESGDTERAIDAFMEFNGQAAHRRILRPEVVKRILLMPKQGIREQLAQLRCHDPGRAFHLFLMLNDQRRHLANLYENNDVDKIELQTPFFDSNFLEPILASPVEGFLRHEFYMRWLQNFSPALLSVPWQAYPGHVPCQLAAPSGLRYQWRDLFPVSVTRDFKRKLLGEIQGFLGSPLFPKSIISRPALKLAALITRSGLRNYDYLLKMAAVYCRYSAGGGRIENVIR